jgi:beta-lactam-binding protein with PASTA domain
MTRFLLGASVGLAVAAVAVGCGSGETVTVPNVTGIPAKTARAELADQGLRPRIVVRCSSGYYGGKLCDSNGRPWFGSAGQPPPLTAGQTPAAGIGVHPGATVTVYVRGGQ